MRALAHPVRMQVYEILRDEGPMTATELGERIGESPANTSFHLRMLARYGFIEEAERGKGRSRPWRFVTGGMLVRDEELSGEARRAHRAVLQGFRSLLMRQIERWTDEQLTYPKPWRRVGFEMEFRSRLTAAELKEVGEQIGAVLEPYKRPKKEVPKSAKNVTIAVWGFPTDPPEGRPREGTDR